MSSRDLARDISEKELQQAIIELLDTLGYFYHHDRPARTQQKGAGPVRWKNHFAGQKGFPDLVMIGSRVIFAELKSETGQLTSEQRIWIDRLRNAGCETYIWRPRDWLSGDISLVLLDGKP